MAAHTAGHFDYAAANSLLKRSSRAAQVSRHDPLVLAAPEVVLEVSLQELLQELVVQRQQGDQQQQQLQQPAAAAASGSVDGHCSVDPAAALAAGLPAQASTVITATQAGRMDCLVWWLEFDWSPRHSIAYTPAGAAAAPAAAGFDVIWSSSGDVLQPHKWQHVQYLTPPDASPQQQGQQQLRQGQPVVQGQQLLLHVTATAGDLQLSVSQAGAGCKQPGPVGAAAAAPARQQGREILPYHLSMLNDYARTEAYDSGIACAVKQLLQQQQQQQQQQAQQSASGAAAADAPRPVVLDVGCGTGLLSMMAAAAAAEAGGVVQVVGKGRVSEEGLGGAI
jgi:hypothetical protein